MSSGEKPQFAPRPMIPPLNLFVHAVDLIVEIICPCSLGDLSGISRAWIVLPTVVEFTDIA